MTGGELLVGGGTLTLAVATVWLALEARTTRTGAATAERRRLLRSALAEQLDSLRHWLGANPAHGDPALDRIRRGEPRLTAVEDLLNRADLSPDLAVYLVWILGRIHEEWLYWPTVIAVGGSDGESPADHPVNSGVGTWSRMVDRLQVVAALVAAEAARQGFDELQRTHDAAPWTTVLEGPDRERELRSMTDRAHLGAPTFPSGGAFVAVSPEARDREGAATGLRSRAELSRAAWGGR